MVLTTFKCFQNVVLQSKLNHLIGKSASIQHDSGVVDNWQIVHALGKREHFVELYGLI